MPRGLLIITGAPELEDPGWIHDGLLTGFVPPFTQLASFFPASSLETTGSLQEQDHDDVAVWRSIPLQKTRLPTGFSQSHNLHHAYQPDTDFISTVTASFADSTRLSTDLQQSQADFMEQLYENSLAVGDEVRPSQPQTQSFETTASSISASQDVSTEYSIHAGDSLLGGGVAGVGHLSDLEDLPKAAYLESIVPQTMTVNLIVGVISIAEPRTVRTRWGSTKSLVEMLLGDETKSGFSVTFWLSSAKSGGQDNGKESPTETVLRNLRRQDVVLLRNVALGTFSKKVHGHSLHNNMTKVHLLHRRKLDPTDDCGLYTAREMASRKRTHPQLAKAKKVWEWTIDFVGGSEHLGKRKTRSRSVRGWEMPPPDTQ